MKINRVAVAAVSGVVALASLAACSSSSGTDASGSSSAASKSAAPGSVKIALWTPQAGSPKVEVQNMQDMLNAFTKQNPQYAFDYKKYPFDSYATSVQGASAAGQLPCMLAVDAPNAPSWAWSGWLTPLQLPASVTDALIPGAKGVYRDKIYSVGYWDAGLALFARKSVLDKHQIRIPTLENPWTKDEFASVLSTLRQDTAFKYPLSLGNPDIYSGTPFLWSFGGDIVDRATYSKSEGVLNGPNSVAYGKWLQDLVARKYITTAATDGNPFMKGDVPLMWDGNWDSSGSVEKFGNDVLFLPPPNLGKGSVVGAGSFGYGTTSSCTPDQRQGVNKFLEFSLTTDNLVKISDTQQVIPATVEAAGKSKSYGADGPYKAFAQLEANHSKIRPATPAFSVIADVFNKASSDILAGADVQSTLNQAAKDIDADYSANNGYAAK